MIEVQGLSKRFGDLQVLSDVSAIFEEGRINQIIGMSGSGKSVLAKCMVGLHKPEQGRVLYQGRSFLEMSAVDQREIRKEIGMLFQGSALFDSMTVLQNVMFPLTMFAKMTKSEMDERAHNCLQRVKIIDKGHLYPAEISGGMQKRVALARAIAMNPKFLFADEPNSGLDPRTSIVIDELIQELTQEFKTTTVVITHDMNSVMGIGENIIFIHKGQKWWQGDRDGLVNSDNPELNDFVFAGSLMRSVKKLYTRGS